MHFSLKSLIKYLYPLTVSCKFEIIIIEGLSALLFIEESSDLVKELESVLKRLSINSTIITTRISSDSGNLIGHYLWNGAIPNELHIRNTNEYLLEATWYKYNIQTSAFLLEF